jgi:hypothetical protein
VDASSYIFVDANQEGDEAPSTNISVPADPGECIEAAFIFSIEADSILGLGIYAVVQAGTKSQLAGFTISRALRSELRSHSHRCNVNHQLNLSYTANHKAGMYTLASGW